MKHYKFGKGVVGVSIFKSSIFVSQLDRAYKKNEPIDGTFNNTIALNFTTVESIDRMIGDLQEIRKSMMQRKLKKLLALV